MNEVTEVKPLYLVDTNVWLWHWFYQFPERLRQLFRTPVGIVPDQIIEEVDNLLGEVKERIFLTDFTLHTIGIHLGRAGLWDVFVEFAQSWTDHLVRLVGQDFNMLRDMAVQFQLDFDDAYQVAAVQKLMEQTRQSVFIVSYDTDFDRTLFQRLTPTQVLNLEQRR